MRDFLMALFGRKQHNDPVIPKVLTVDPAAELVKRQYQAEKHELLAKTAEHYARLRRMGYDVDVAARRGFPPMQDPDGQR